MAAVKKLSALGACEEPDTFGLLRGLNSPDEVVEGSGLIGGCGLTPGVVDHGESLPCAPKVPRSWGRATGAGSRGSGACRGTRGAESFLADALLARIRSMRSCVICLPSVTNRCSCILRMASAVEDTPVFSIACDTPLATGLCMGGVVRRVGEIGERGWGEGVRLLFSAIDKGDRDRRMT